jgi:hypothetical protein
MQQSMVIIMAEAGPFDPLNLNHTTLARISVFMTIIQAKPFTLFLTLKKRAVNRKMIAEQEQKITKNLSVKKMPSIADNPVRMNASHGIRKRNFLSIGYLRNSRLKYSILSFMLRLT